MTDPTTTLPAPKIVLTIDPTLTSSVLVTAKSHHDGTVEVSAIKMKAKKKKPLYVAIVTTEDGDVMVFGPYTDKGKAEDKGERKMIKYMSNNAQYRVTQLEK
jgi:uncharacterized OB-fold protein